MDHQTMCTICNKKMDKDGQDFAEVRMKGAKIFISKSISRYDGYHEKWEDELQTKSCIAIHESCRKKYSALSATRKRDRENDLEHNSPITIGSNTKRLCDDTVHNQSSQAVPVIKFSFDYLNNCIVCGKFLNKNHSQIRDRTKERKEKYMNIVSNENHANRVNINKRLDNIPSVNHMKPRYHVNCDKLFTKPQPANHQPGHLSLKKDSEDEAFQSVCNHIETSGDFEFHLSTLRKIMGTNTIQNQPLFAKLKKKYGDDIHVSRGRGREPVILYKTSNIFSDYYDKKCLSDLQKKTVLTLAARILQTDVKNTAYENDVYAAPDKFLDTVESDVPNSMHIFLEEYSSKSDGNEENHGASVKKASIAHSMISLIRPEGFCSNLQLAAGVYIYRKTGSKLIIQILSKLGVVASYHCILLYEASVIMDPPKIITGEVFLQFVFDNTDHNVATLDGFFTFHCLGGIAIFTPAHEIRFEGGSIRLKKMPTADELAAKTQIKIVPIGEFDEEALKNIEFVSTSSLHLGESPVISPSNAGYIWAHAFEIAEMSLWRRYLQVLSRKMSYHTSYILCLPFITQPPSNLTTLNTAAHYAISEAHKVGMKTPILTMDQPLHWKFRCILAQGLLEAVARLGGFHLLMSFKGATCFIMDGSGLDDLWSTAYAPESIKKMFTGHAFSRALRAHIISLTAMASEICKKIDVDDSSKDFIRSFFQDWNKDDSPGMSECNSEEFLKQLAEKFMAELEKLKSNGPTAAL
ncbi:hypothetical protein QAD02_003315 [Eretmocerus hayati]|uniref:Uncharacterized protein n=1 Tax=Eretmocerus hayati TaxID=131215 RepID=A0ACC2NN63_9HYME|nr:hypothetical protein QAD02_003315 [Eretmocerus hayati]